MRQLEGLGLKESLTGCVKKLMQPVFYYVLYVHGQCGIFGGCSGEHPYTLDNQRISPIRRGCTYFDTPSWSLSKIDMKSSGVEMPTNDSSLLFSVSLTMLML